MAEPPERPSDPVLARKLERAGDPTGRGVAIGDAAGCIEWVNAAFQRLTGYPAAELCGKRIDLLRGLDVGAPALDHVLTRFRRGEPARLEIPARGTSGDSRRWLDIEVVPLGPDEGFVALVRDVTARKRAEQGGEARRTATVDPTTAPSGPTPVPRLTLQPVDLSLLVMQSYELLEASVSGRTLLDLDLAGNLPPVGVDVLRLREVLVSLVLHAAEGLAGAPGAIRVRTGLRGQGSRPQAVELEVRDTGFAERVRLAGSFDPSRSRRSLRVLGLSEIRAVVEAHGGRLALTSHPEQGTRALALLPCADLHDTRT